MEDYKHYLLSGVSAGRNYVAVGGGGGDRQSPPRPDHVTRGQQLERMLNSAVRRAEARTRSDSAFAGITFLPLRFTEDPTQELPTERLENLNRGIRILNRRTLRDGSHEYLLAVPDAQVRHFARRFQQYQQPPRPEHAPRNEPLCAGIAEINSTDLRDYWTDVEEQLPPREEDRWYEVWLEVPGEASAKEVAGRFRAAAVEARVPVSPENTAFPDRVVLLAYASLETLSALRGFFADLAELRLASIVAGEFTRLPPRDQGDFVRDAVARTTPPPEDAPAVCVLDTGVRRGHPMLSAVLSAEDTQCYRVHWTTGDHDGHGTTVAGLAEYGCLTDPIWERQDEPVVLTHRLESVKILPDRGANDSPDYGPITVGSMALAEYAAPKRRRVFCMAVTASDRELWRPTLWSAAVDQAVAEDGEESGDGTRRLLVVSAGNIQPASRESYPAENLVSSVEDPAQAWNVLSVGACTEKVHIGDPSLSGYSPLAKPGTLSPSSRTSGSWDRQPWPFKPDVVFEGGNYAADPSGFVTNADDLDLLTTAGEPGSDALLTTCRATTAASAQVARIGAMIWADRSDYWAETVRGLIVHTAEWTPRMREEFPHRERETRVRTYGMGVPSLERALRSARARSTVIYQDSLRPYRWTSDGSRMNEMRLHDLPIPVGVLQDLGALPVRMRVTLSYYIEPNPPRRGWVAQHQYASHGLRFDVKRPNETATGMLERLSKAERPEVDGQRTRTAPSVDDDRDWELGPKMRVRGSIHSDAWEGTAAQLAASDKLCVFPVGGWWKSRADREQVERRARYSLLVTISTGETLLDPLIDLHQEVGNVLGVTVPTETATEVEVS